MGYVINIFDKSQIQSNKTINFKFGKKLTTNKANQLFLADNEFFDMNNTLTVNKECCYFKLMTSNNEINMLSRNKNGIRKTTFEQVKTRQWNTTFFRLPTSSIDENTTDISLENSNHLIALRRVW